MEPLGARAVEVRMHHIALFSCLAFAQAPPIDFEGVEIRGELVQPSGMILFTTPKPLTGDRSDRWRVVRGRELDRRLSRSSSQAERLSWLEERGELLRREAEDLTLAAYRAMDAAFERGDDLVTPDLVDAQALHDQAADCYEEALTLAVGDDAARLGVLLGATLYELDRRDLATAAWQIAVAASPSGPWAAEAHLHLAERAFEQADLTPAIQHYEASLAANAEGEKAAYVQYKLAWCLYNLGDFPAAIERLVPLTAVAASALNREARKDVVRFASHLPVGEAQDVIAQVCRGDVTCLEDLSRRLQDLLADR